MPQEVASALANIEKESQGEFKLISVKPSLSSRKVLAVGIIKKEGRPILDVSNLYWKIVHSEKPIYKCG